MATPPSAVAFVGAQPYATLGNPVLSCTSRTTHPPSHVSFARQGFHDLPTLVSGDGRHPLRVQASSSRQFSVLLSQEPSKSPRRCRLPTGTNPTAPMSPSQKPRHGAAAAHIADAASVGTTAQAPRCPSIDLCECLTGPKLHQLPPAVQG